MAQTRAELETGIERYRELIFADPALKTEFEGSLAQFFQGGLPVAAAPLEALSSSRRHLEWFVFERHSPRLRNRPAEALLEAWQESLPHRPAGLEGSLLESFSGLFEVVETLEDGQTRVIDLSGLGSFEMTNEAGLFEVGDLVVGRLYPSGDGTFLPSSVCAPIRDGRVLAAVKTDVERIRDERDRKVFRIAQAELESMFFSVFARSVAAQPESPTVSIDAARSWLASGGLQPEAIDAILQDLREHPISPENLHPGVGDVVGHWLDELAFSTPLALEETRARLLAAWTAMHLPSTGATEASVDQHGSEGVDIASAMAEFERDCANGRAVSAALADLEAKLALDADEEDDVGSAPDFPGVVGAMVEEFLWEEESQFGSASIEGCAVLHAFSSYSQHLGVFEELSRKDVADFATRWLPEHPAACELARIPTLLGALTKFTVWARETHGALALADVDELLQSLRGTLERIMAFSASCKDQTAGELFQIHAIEAGQVHLTNMERDGEEQVLASSELPGLQVGEFVRLRVQAGSRIPTCAYPSQLGLLLRDLADA